MLFSFKSLIKGHLMIIICTTTVPSCPNNELGVSCSMCLIATFPAIEIVLFRYKPTTGSGQNMRENKIMPYTVI